MKINNCSYQPEYCNSQRMAVVGDIIRTILSLISQTVSSTCKLRAENLFYIYSVDFLFIRVLYVYSTLESLHWLRFGWFLTVLSRRRRPMLADKSIKHSTVKLSKNTKFLLMHICRRSFCKGTISLHVQCTCFNYMYLHWTLPGFWFRCEPSTWWLSCNNIALPYFLILTGNIKILKIGDGYVIAATED